MLLTTDSELTWLFIGIAGLALAAMAAFNRIARRRPERKSATVPPPRRERVAARTKPAGLPPLPEHLRPKVPEKPLPVGPGRPSVLVLEEAATGRSLLLLQRADALEAEGDAPGVVRIAAFADPEEAAGDAVTGWIADRAGALDWEPDGTLSRDVWLVTLTSFPEEGREAAGEVRPEAVAPDGVMLRALDGHGLPMGEAVPAPFDADMLLSAARRRLAHEEPGVVDLLEAVRTRMTALLEAGDCSGALPELPGWLDGLARIVEARAAGTAGAEAEKALDETVGEARRRVEELAATEPLVDLAVLCACERFVRTAVLTRAVFRSAPGVILADAAGIASGRRRIEEAFGEMRARQAAGDEEEALVGRMRTDAADVVALLDRRMIASGGRVRLLVRF